MNHTRLTRLGRWMAQAIATIGMTRHGMLAATRHAAPNRAVGLAQRTIALVVGSGSIGAGVALFSHARLGLPPYDVFLSMLSRFTGLSHGQTAWSASVVMLALAALLGRRPQAWGIVFIVLVGLSIDGVADLLADPTSILGRIVFVILESWQSPRACPWSCTRAQPEDRSNYSWPQGKTADSIPRRSEPGWSCRFLLRESVSAAISALRRSRLPSRSDRSCGRPNKPWPITRKVDGNA